jgi:hypothetical protein
MMKGATTGRTHNCTPFFNAIIFLSLRVREQRTLSIERQGHKRSGEGIFWHISPFSLGFTALDNKIYVNSLALFSQFSFEQISTDESVVVWCGVPGRG